MSISLINAWPLHQIATGAASLINPFVDALSYAFPKFVPYFKSTIHLEETENRSQDLVAKLDQRRWVIERINELAQLAKLHRKIDVHTSIQSAFANYGGSYSLARPVIHVPLEHLFRNNDNGTFGKEVYEDEKHERFTDAETKFLILRELVAIKMNISLYKLVTRSMMVASLMLFHFNPIGWMISLTMFLTSLLVHVVVHRVAYESIDQQAIESLKKCYPKDLKKSYLVAMTALKKQQAQNMEWRNLSGCWGKLLYNRTGNCRFNLMYPSIELRIWHLNLLKARFNRLDQGIDKLVRAYILPAA